ncbi:hypothetical protein J4Q44_G00303750 [Coregonus suidteri]|uniref:Uncharacterized protein n=1 Tax=Coregonus suidteri TaxID=861788 RepID=A0AAN8QBK2_9TELE
MIIDAPRAEAQNLPGDDVTDTTRAEVDLGPQFVVLLRDKLEGASFVLQDMLRNFLIFHRQGYNSLTAQAENVEEIRTLISAPGRISIPRLIMSSLHNDVVMHSTSDIVARAGVPCQTIFTVLTQIRLCCPEEAGSQPRIRDLPLCIAPRRPEMFGNVRVPVSPAARSAHHARAMWALMESLAGWRGTVSGAFLLALSLSCFVLCP